MRARTGSRLSRLSRDRLEELAEAAFAEAQHLRTEVAPNGFFHALLAGLLIGSTLSATAFLIGAAIR